MCKGPRIDSELNHIYTPFFNEFQTVCYSRGVQFFWDVQYFLMGGLIKKKISKTTSQPHSRNTVVNSDFIKMSMKRSFNKRSIKFAKRSKLCCELPIFAIKDQPRQKAQITVQNSHFTSFKEKITFLNLTKRKDCLKSQFFHL